MEGAAGDWTGQGGVRGAGCARLRGGPGLRSGSREEGNSKHDQYSPSAAIAETHSSRLSGCRGPGVPCPFTRGVGGRGSACVWLSSRRLEGL